MGTNVYAFLLFNLYNEIKTLICSLQVVSALGKQEAERKFETLLSNLSHPPSFTTVRVNSHLASAQHVKNLLFDELHKVCASFLFLCTALYCSPLESCE